MLPDVTQLPATFDVLLANLQVSLALAPSPAEVANDWRSAGMDMVLQEELTVGVGVGLGVQEEQLKYIVYFVQGQYWHFLAICALLCAVPCCLVVPPPLPAPAAAGFIRRFTVLACLCALQKKSYSSKT